MAEVLFINEEFYKKMIPSVRAINDDQIISSIRLVQKTNLVELVSEPVYDYIQTIFSTNSDFTANEARLFAHIQSWLAVTCAHELTMSSPTRDDVTRDEASKVYLDKSTKLAGMIVRDINNTPNLLALAQGTGVETWSDSEDDSNSAFFFV